MTSVSIYQCGSASTDTSNYRAPGGERPDRLRKLGRDCLELSVMSVRSRLLDFGAFLIRVSIYHGGSVSTDTSNYSKPEENGPDRQRQLERDCLEI